MRRVATKIFLAFAVALVAFAAVAAFAIARLHEARRDLRLLSSGYLPLTRVAAQLEVKDWVAARAVEARGLDPAARRAYLPVARAHFPAFVKEQVAEGQAVAEAARAFAREGDARFLAEVSDRLDALARRWAEYDKEANALFDALEQGDLAPGALEARAATLKGMERGLTLDVKLLQASLESQIGDRVQAAERAEGRTVVLIILYSLLALAIGVGAALVAQRLLAPIQVLTEGVKAVASGDLGRSVEEPRSADELGVLAREFNAMAASLSRQRDDLRRAERLAAVGRISAQITHEIRNPLNAMGLNAELLAEELSQLPEPPKEALGLVAAISREVDRLDAVAEEYLRFSRPPRASAARIDVAEVLGGLLDFLGPELQAAKVEVRRELAAGLPPVRADEGQLRAVFLNLVRNSREAMPGGGTVTAAVRLDPAGGQAGDGSTGVEVRLSDTGGGIPAGDLTRIFEPFYSTKERGTGLGLAYVREVVVQHGGTIRCESELGRGTTFTIRLPAAAPDFGADAPQDVGGERTAGVTPGFGAGAPQGAGGEA